MADKKKAKPSASAPAPTIKIITLNSKQKAFFENFLKNPSNSIQNEIDYINCDGIYDLIKNIKSTNIKINETQLGSLWLQKAIKKVLLDNKKYKQTVTSPSGGTTKKEESTEIISIPESPPTSSIDPNAPGEIIKSIEKNFSKSLYRLKKEKPYFRKSYSVLSSYTPLIKCSISIPTEYINTEPPDKKIKKRQFQFFDIPYNYIKSLKAESTTGDSLNSKLTLVLEDPIGTTAAILVATLHLLAMTDASKMPKISIIFGWGGNERISRIIGRKNNYYFKTTQDKLYIIQKAEITYENLKQKLTLECVQDLTSIDDILRNHTPYSIFGTNYLGQIIVTNRVAAYGRIQSSLDFSGSITKNDKVENILVTKQLITEFSMDNTLSKFVIDYPIYGGLKKQKTAYYQCPYLFSFGLTSNELYNSKWKKKDGAIIASANEIFAPWNVLWNRAKFHQYNIFCFILNAFIKTLKDNKSDLKIIIIPLFNEKNIVAIESGVYYQTLEKKDSERDKIFSNSIAESAYIKDSIIYKSVAEIGKDQTRFYTSEEQKLLAPLNFEDTKFDDNASWISLLNNFASKVKVYLSPENRKDTESLSISIEYFKPSAKNTDRISDEKSNSLLKSIQQLIIDAFKKSGADENSTLGNLNKQIADIKNDTIFIFIGTKQNNYSVKNKPLQKYTIFPNVKPAIKPNTQFFNSGSKNLLDGSFPDVISFQPNLNFTEAIVSSLAQRGFMPVINEKGKTIGNNDTFSYKLKDGVESNESSNLAMIEHFNSYYEKIKNILSNKKSSEEIVLKYYDDTNKYWYDVKYPNYEFSCKSWENIPKFTFSKTVADIGISRTAGAWKEFKIEKDKPLDANQIAALSKFVIDFEEESAKINSQTYTKTIANVFVKIPSISPGDRTSSSYASFLSRSNDFFRILKRSVYNFDADLKILGEPAFSFLWGSQPYLFIEVNNPDGSQNILLSGVYMVTGFTHDIEGGKFTTTLKLKYDSPYVENFLIDNSSKKDEGK